MIGGFIAVLIWSNLSFSDPHMCDCAILDYLPPSAWCEETRCISQPREQKHRFYRDEGKLRWRVKLDLYLFFGKKTGREVVGQNSRRHETTLRCLGWCLRMQGVVVVCLAVNHPHSDFLCCLLTNAPQQPAALPLLCVTVWELCRAGGSPRSAPGRPRGHQLVYWGPHWGTDTEKRVRVYKWIYVFSSGGVFKRPGHKTVLTSPPTQWWCGFPVFSHEFCQHWSPKHVSWNVWTPFAGGYRCGARLPEPESQTVWRVPLQQKTTQTQEGAGTCFGFICER